MEEDEDAESDPEERKKKLKVVEDNVFQYVCVMNIPFVSENAANITMESLAVDEELSPNKVIRNFRVEGNVLQVEIKSTEERLLKAAVLSFFDMVMVALRFLCEFD